MAYSSEGKILARRELQSLLGPRAITRDSASREDDREHIGAKHLRDGCTPDITSQIRENDGLGKKTKSFPSDCSESKIEG
jgi:hypothetical protein